MLVIGHRGAADLAPENTMESLRAGFEAGADILEFDVRLTKDCIPVVIHDATTVRTHGKRIVISHHTYEELEALQLSPAIPALSDVLDEYFGRIMLNIELKSKGSGAAVVRLLATSYIQHDSDWDNVLISSFRGRELIATRKANKRVPLALLHDQNPFLFIAYHRWIHLSAVGFHRLYINQLAVEIARRVGLFCYAYTVNRPYGAYILAGKHIDGVVTNKPDSILSEINKRNERP